MKPTPNSDKQTDLRARIEQARLMVYALFASDNSDIWYWKDQLQDLQTELKGLETDESSSKRCRDIA